MPPTDQRDRPWAPLWPAYAAAGFVGLFCAVVLVLAVANAFAEGAWPEGDGWVALGSVGLRILTVALALASVRPWGRRLPGRLVLGGLWGSAAAQFVYPALELIVKLLILAGVPIALDKGISNMSATGWFNFAAVWVVFGVPALLFGLAAVSYQRRSAASSLFAWLGVLGGCAALLLIGVLIG
ncbi:hypothetical protein ACIBG7_35235 [Nonomuraea sp. NPDC050328]|uniref:hypothetical protein n=1 Tax=Nonomuraea sp. NPDC050328 TaxID=3364361 RepID=UPI0037967776